MDLDGGPGGGALAVRVGSYRSDATQVRSAPSGGELVAPDTQDTRYGIRCVVDLAPKLSVGPQ